MQRLRKSVQKENKFAMQNLHLPFGLINEPLKFRTDHSVCNLHQLRNGHGGKCCGYTVPNKF
jgi:hypothetical protein